MGVGTCSTWLRRDGLTISQLIGTSGRARPPRGNVCQTWGSRNGCGFDGLDWRLVKNMIEGIFKDTGIDICDLAWKRLIGSLLDASRVLEPAGHESLIDIEPLLVSGNRLGYK